MKTKILFLGLISALLVGCHRVPVSHEIAQTESLAHTSTHELLDYTTPCPLPNLSKTFDAGFSRDEAIHIALLNNRALRASFQELGIAKADLIQAGLLQNPTITGAFNIPKQGTGITTNIELESSLISLTDLWQIPLRKRVFSAQLERTIFSLVDQILHTMVGTRHAYDNALFSQELLRIVTMMLAKAQELRDNLTHRYGYGLENNADLYLSQAAVGFWNTLVQTHTADLFQAHMQLRYVLGVDLSHEKLFTLTEKFNALSLDHSVGQYLDWALTGHPKVQLALKKIAYFKALVEYEKARRIKMAAIGVAYKQDFEPTSKGIGPHFALEVPLFDNNFAHIARAEYGLLQAEKELSDLRLKITTEVQAHYKMLSTLDTTIKNYQENILSYHEKAILYALDYQKVMQITIPTVIQMQKDYFEAQRDLLHLIHRELITYTDLELGIGQRLSDFRTIGGDA